MRRKALLPMVLFLALGLLLWGMAKIARYSVGCPLSGDCYLPGWGMHHLAEMALIAWFVFLPFAVLRLVRRALDSKVESACRKMSNE
jgi:hypothetical protein